MRFKKEIQIDLVGMLNLAFRTGECFGIKEQDG